VPPAAIDLRDRSGDAEPSESIDMGRSSRRLVWAARMPVLIIHDLGDHAPSLLTRLGPSLLVVPIRSACYFLTCLPAAPVMPTCRAASECCRPASDSTG